MARFNINQLTSFILVTVFMIGVAYALQCYDCNSSNDPRCGDPFDPYSIAEVNCSTQDRPGHLNNSEPVLCRKSVMKVYGKERVVRGCGYVTHEADDKICLRRAGTHDVQVLYCSCTGNNCNSSNKLYSVTHITVFIAIILISFYYL